MTTKPKLGRPAPLGRKVVCSVRLTPAVAEFCRQHPDGFPVLESTRQVNERDAVIEKIRTALRQEYSV